ncbi:hypothetical protein DXG03_005372 [Asterophora parasitica]|uniref:F-box domain-containing protein n=1 Tax=Asterophora parasitica TaxID=117018 RepID=A0A9P7G0F0_9AGAR|nr:hypothetical protein DXG03_005372 [Asterophora parasitica]
MDFVSMTLIQLYPADWEHNISEWFVRRFIHRPGLTDFCAVPILPDNLTEQMEAEVRAFTRPPSEKDPFAQARAVVSLLKDNNSEPSNSQSFELGAAIDRLDQRIAQDKRDLTLCQLRINSLLSNIARLLEDKDDAQTQQNYFKAYQSSLQRLSPEVLTHIFSYNVIENITPLKMPTMVAISQVCRAWRSASFGGSTPWNSLSMVADIGVPFPVWDRMLQQLPGMMFVHAKNQPLRLSLPSKNMEVYVDRGIPSGGILILDSIFPFFHNLTHLRIQSPVNFSFATFLHLPSGMVPSLECLELWQHPFSDDEITNFQSSVFASSSRSSIS